jgi:N-acetylglucosamine-6-phosphate deacetylase
MLQPARRGAHPRQRLVPPAAELVEGWSRDAGVLMVTLAPELPGALDVIRLLTQRGVLVSIGHTDATTTETLAAVEAGARLVTHLGNAMPPLTAREPGPMGVALAGPDLVAGVIADGVHLDAVTLRLAWRALGPDRFLAVTDTTAGLGLPDGTTRLGDQEVRLDSGTVRLADGTLAGSAASLPDCLRVLTTQAGASLDEAVATCTTTPARLLGLPDRDDHTELDDDLAVVATIIDGETVYRRED